MRITITVDADNVAFGETPTTRARVVNGLLNDVRHWLHESGLHAGETKPLLDVNGNRVGQATVTDD